MKGSKAAHALRMIRRIASRRLRGRTEAETGRYSGAELRDIRARNGVGRPSRYIDTKGALFTESQPAPAIGTRVNFYVGVVAQHGSQRKAAAALGISLGKFQRELRKAA